MKLSDFDYDLPEDLIALRPARPRRSARLLVVRGGSSPFEDETIEALPRLLRAGDLLVFNNTKVVAARLEGVRRRDTSEGEGARIEATLIERRDADTWAALAKPGKRLKSGDEIVIGPELSAQVLDKEPGGVVTLRFSTGGAALDQAIEQLGAPPLPPYIAARRPTDAADADDYQTIFAKNPGAVAAPTASLHFDQAMLAALDAASIGRVEVTLHVGAGTFLPVTVDDVSKHKMHAEEGLLGPDAASEIARAKSEGRRVIPVGTTALRLLETAAAQTGDVAPWSGATDLFIRPGHVFKAADALLTNFHLPKSTLMMLVAAMAGRERVLAAYAHAVASRYRFYSYGDACLLLPGG